MKTEQTTARTRGLRTVVLSCAAVVALLFIGTARAPAAPNILIITVDNLGYGDLRTYRPQSPIHTPHLDRLAAQGARLTQFYTASPTCTVSRACLLTGRIADRHGLVNQLPGIEGNYGVGLQPTEILIPQVLKQAGYATGCFGKWNIGFAPGSRPTERGFDEFFGHASGNIDYYTHVYNSKHDLYRGVEQAHVEGYSTDLFADAAIDFIRRHDDRSGSWFVYLPFNAPHFPNPKNKAPDQPCVWQAPAAAFERYGYDPTAAYPRNDRRGYHAVVTALDTAIGRVLNAINDQAQPEGTFIFFFSDNGAFMLEDRGLEVASNAPLRDGGVTCWEGGLRVPAIVRWTGRIPAGSVVRAPLWSPDLLVACSKLSGAPLPTDRVLDGRDPLPALTRNASSPHESFFFRFRRHAALRQGDWKIVRTRPDEAWQLFNLSRDVGEQNDLADRHPQKVKQLEQVFQRWITSIQREKEESS